LPENCGENVRFSKLDAQTDYEDDLKWKKALGVHSFVTGKSAMEIFSDPNWPATILFDLDISMNFWNEVYAPVLQGRRPA
jgi:hypothetical protein